MKAAVRVLRVLLFGFFAGLLITRWSRGRDVGVRARARPSVCEGCPALRSCGRVVGPFGEGEPPAEPLAQRGRSGSAGAWPSTVRRQRPDRAERILNGDSDAR